ncbi:hypothetical protein DPMN_142700 [Dreissena polymorpha]|uniref:Uncharacterized protein n=1 Tax=Dreissena polymorpha TaxID=45954 RepID=A0A9D4JIX6_DREPO|nr:hypothetical protein DPMN_142700 [Dreissena polymorpha]
MQECLQTKCGRTDGRWTKTDLKTSPELNQGKNLTFRVFTRFLYSHKTKTAPHPGGHFHDDWAKIVTSRVFTSFFFYCETIIIPKIVTSRVFTRKTAHHPPTLAAIMTKFKLDGGIIGKILIGQEMKTAPTTGGHVFQQTGSTFELNQHIIKRNILTK